MTDQTPIPSRYWTDPIRAELCACGVRKCKEHGEESE